MMLDKFSFDHVLDLFPDGAKNRINGLIGVEQRPDFHPEGNVFNHTKIVTNRLAKYRVPELAFAGILHDVGKDCTSEMSDSGIIRAIGHEKVSAEYVLELRDFLSQFCDVSHVHFIVSNHMRVKHINDMRPTKIARLLKEPAGGMLMLFKDADDMSTLKESLKIVEQ